MNLGFADVSASFSNMLQQASPSEAMLTLNDANAGRKMFGEKLDKTLKFTHRLENTHVISDHGDDPPVDVEKVSQFLSGKLGEKEGHQYVSALQSILLMLSNGKLEDISIDAAGLESLKKMLLEAGFKQADIEDAISTLSQDFDEEELSLDLVFDALFDLPFEPDATEVEETFLSPSESPFIESMLLSLGIPAEKIQEIMSLADKGETGVSLDVVIEELQKLQKSDFYTNPSYQVSKSDSPIGTLARAIGLKIDTDQPGTFSLNDIVRSLETLRQDKTQPIAEPQAQIAAVSEKPADLLNSLFKSLNIKQDIKQDGTSGRGIEFSTDKIQHSFENPFLMDGQDAAPKKGVFGAKILEFLKKGDVNGAVKEMEAILNGNAKDSPVPKNPLAEFREGLLKSAGSREKKMPDQSQGQVFETKTNESDPRVGLTKARPAAKPLPAYVTQQVGKSLVRAINQGENDLKIQLKPPELGRLLMTIDNTGNSMRVSIMTENHAAKEIITQNITELRTVLSNSGVNLERVEVDMSSDFRQSMADARQQAGQSGKRSGNKTRTGAGKGGAEGIDSTAGELSKLNLNHNGSVHLVA